VPSPPHVVTSGYSDYTPVTVRGDNSALITAPQDDVREALAGLIEAVERDTNGPDQKGISGYTSARLSDARRALAGKAQRSGDDAVVDQIIGQIEERFPNWRSYRDLIDCIDCTLHDLRGQQRAADDDEAYELGKRDGYESAIQDLDIATGGDGEFRGSTIPDETVDVPAMKARVIERLRDESRLRQCTICGFTVDTSFAAVKPSADFTTRGRAKSLPNESAIRADERERCAKVAEAEYADKNWHAMYRHAAGAIAAAIRAGRGEG